MFRLKPFDWLYTLLHLFIIAPSETVRLQKIKVKYVVNTSDLLNQILEKSLLITCYGIRFRL